MSNIKTALVLTIAAIWLVSDITYNCGKKFRYWLETLSDSSATATNYLSEGPLSMLSPIIGPMIVLCDALLIIAEDIVNIIENFNNNHGDRMKVLFIGVLRWLLKQPTASQMKQ